MEELVKIANNADALDGSRLIIDGLAVVKEATADEIKYFKATFNAST